MISPLAQRQLFQTANMEALRQAQDVGEQFQRELAKVQASNDRMQEGAETVHKVTDSEHIRTEERHGRGQHGRGSHGEHGPEEDQEPPEENKADSAEPHLDLMA